ncbi:MAG TPA: hypothetical protein VHL30_02510 [Chlamydiales bacterium]|nr:hypothetical protein [Chlamydiales bacterium]
MLRAPLEELPGPAFGKGTSAEQEAWRSFFSTNSEAIRTGASLTELVACAEKVQSILLHYNPIFDTWGQTWNNQADLKPARQWEIDQLAEVKKRLIKAVVYKREYYENHWFGVITKIFLKLFCLWNNGDTAAIVAAEDFLVRWNFPEPQIKHDGEYETTIQFTPENEENQAPVPGSVGFYEFLDLDWTDFPNYIPDRFKQNQDAAQIQ